MDQVRTKDSGQGRQAGGAAMDFEQAVEACSETLYHLVRQLAVRGLERAAKLLAAPFDQRIANRG